MSVGGPLTFVDDWLKEKSKEAFDAITKPIELPTAPSSSVPWWMWGVAFYLLSKRR